MEQFLTGCITLSTDLKIGISKRNCEKSPCTVLWILKFILKKMSGTDISHL